jgi:quinoprotein glucose dehydrogenase
VNWGGATADPTTGFVYVNAHDTSLVGWIERRRPGLNYGNGVAGSTLPYDRGSVNGAGPYFTFSAPYKDSTGRTLANPSLPASAMGRLVAVNANTGEIRVGEHAGTHRGAARRQAAHRWQRQPRSDGNGGRSALRRRDQRSPLPRVRLEDGQGAVVDPLEATVNAKPDDVSRKNGEQFVAFIATDTLVAYALP